MLRSSLLALGALAVASTFGIAQQSGVSLSPFVTFVPEADGSPLAGLSLAITGGSLSLRAGGHLSVRDRAPANSFTSMKPWGADADAVAYLESYNYNQHVLFTPYVFAGLSTAALDSGRYRLMHQGWSYGGGLVTPMGSALGAFAEARWRMSQYVLPNAQNAPAATREMRLGLSFRVGGGGTATEIVHVLSATDVGLGDPGGGANRAGSRVISTAETYVGTPYRRGGTSPSSGFDASGFVRFVFSMLGVNLPRLSRDQARVGERVRPDLNALTPGDLVMFQDEGGINHVAIYVGRARIIHSSETGGGVRIDDLNSDRGRWFLEHLAAARRVIPDARGMLLDLARGFPSDMPSGSDGPDHAPRVPGRRRN